MAHLRWGHPGAASPAQADLLLAAGAAFRCMADDDADGALAVLLQACLGGPTRAAALMMLDYYGKPRLTASCPSGYAIARSFEAQLGGGPVLDCVRSGQPAVQESIRRRHRQPYAVWARRAGCTSAAAVPILSAGRPVGAVALLGCGALPVSVAAAVADTMTAIVARDL